MGKLERGGGGNFFNHERTRIYLPGSEENILRELREWTRILRGKNQNIQWGCTMSPRLEFPPGSGMPCAS